MRKRSWRAGAGLTRRSTDACRKNDGRHPGGHYRPRLYATFWGSLIKGDQVCRWEYPRSNDYRSWGELVTAWRACFDLDSDSDSRVRVHVRR